MSRGDPVAAAAARIQAAWEGGRIWRLSGAGLRASAQEAGRRRDAGVLSPEAAAGVAAATENVALAFEPLGARR